MNTNETPQGEFAVRSCEPNAKNLADALLALVRADDKLNYCCDSASQDEWNRSAEAYRKAFLRTLPPSPPPVILQ